MNNTSGNMLDYKRSSPNLFRTRFKRLLDEKFSYDTNPRPILASKQENAVPVQINPKWTSYTPVIEPKMFELIQLEDGKTQIQPAEKRAKLSDDSIMKLDRSNKPLSKILTKNRLQAHRLPFFLRKQKLRSNQQSMNDSTNIFTLQPRVQKNKVILQRLLDSSVSSEMRSPSTFDQFKRFKPDKPINEKTVFEFSKPISLLPRPNSIGYLRVDENNQVFRFSKSKNVHSLDDDSELEDVRMNVEDEILKPRDTSLSVIVHLTKCPVCRHLSEVDRKRCKICKHKFLKRSNCSFTFSRPKSISVPTDIPDLSSIKPSETFVFTPPSTDFNGNDSNVESLPKKLIVNIKSQMNNIESEEEFQYFKNGVLLKFRNLFAEKQTRLKKKEERISKAEKKINTLPVKTNSETNISFAAVPTVHPSPLNVFTKSGSNSTSKVPFEQPSPFPTFSPAKKLSPVKSFSFKTPTETLPPESSQDEGTSSKTPPTFTFLPEKKDAESIVPKPSLFETKEKAPFIFGTNAGTSKAIETPKTSIFEFKNNNTVNTVQNPPANPFLLKPSFNFSNAAKDQNDTAKNTPADEDKTKNIFAMKIPKITPSMFALKDPSKTEKVVSPKFTFGSGTNNLFDSSQTLKPSENIQPAKADNPQGFSFANANKDSSTSIFTFGTKKSTDSNPASSPAVGFSFGNANKPINFSLTSNLPATAPKVPVPSTGFNLGAPTTSGLSFNFAKPAAETQSQNVGFVFGAKTNPVITEFNFGLKPAAPVVNPFQSKGQENQPIQSSALPAVPFTFGASSNDQGTSSSNNIFAPTAPKVGFGDSFANASSQALNNMNFSAPQRNPPTLNFGSSAVTSSFLPNTNPTFGAPQPTTQTSNPAPLQMAERKVIRARRRHN